MNDIIKTVIDIQTILISSKIGLDMEYRPDDEYFMFHIRNESLMRLIDSGFFLDSYGQTHMYQKDNTFKAIKNILDQSNLKWSIDYMNDFLELRIDNKTPKTYNPIEKAYDILVNNGDVEEAIGYLGEALAD